MKRMLLHVRRKPTNFQGTIRLPASKSYLHRALIVAALSKGSSKITGCGSTLSDDVEATLRVLKSLGMKIGRNSAANGTISVTPNWTRKKKAAVYLKGSGTTARLAVAFAALAPGGVETRFTGDTTLSRRPMQEILDALTSLGCKCHSEKDNGRLPVVVKGGGMRGGSCEVDGSISSQFVSSLLIACTKARKDCAIKIKNPGELVSKPYIDATLSVLEHFGFEVKVLSKRSMYLGFNVKGNQTGKGASFQVPGDMSAAAALIGATASARGRLDLLGVDLRLPQSDSVFLSFADKLGARISKQVGRFNVRSASPSKGIIRLELKEAPDLVPAVAGVAAGMGCNVRISNIGHLRFKESDRLHTLATEIRKLGVETKETGSTLSVLGSSRKRAIRKPIFLDPHSDHRMLMAFAIAAVSGRFGEVFISDPDCVAKSYPDFVRDLQLACGEKDTIALVRRV
ncbi:MAG: 3-phosphoshikimate 1-carboxyvinyltransferase [Nitrososphaerota archaeon]|nr:3-phosphoshikimate 1-carboxyvinyltransferase [Nitrososphaerota archaeon]